MNSSDHQEVHLAFSFSDEDFMAFLPESAEEQWLTPWSDFNYHDPGVTAYEAMQLSFEDFIYRYRFPIQDLMQGRGESAFDTWGVEDLYTTYAVTEDDYRRVLATSEYLENIVVKPVLMANLEPNTVDLICLLDVNVVTKPLNIPYPVIKDWEKALIKDRAVGEYFNRQKDNKTFIREKVVNLTISTKLSLYPSSDEVTYYRRIFNALAAYLLPNLEPVDYRTVQKDELDQSELHTGPAPNKNAQKNVIDQTLLDRKAYRRYIVVAELFEVLEKLSFIRSVKSISIKVEGGVYENAILDLGDFTFAKLTLLQVNDRELTDHHTEMLALHPALPKPSDPDFIKDMKIQGRYRNLSASESLQSSFPPNYEMGRYLMSQSEFEIKKTSSFRAYLYLIDQIRANISGQMGEFYKIFSINLKMPVVVEVNLAGKPFYQGIEIPKFNNDELPAQSDRGENEGQQAYGRYLAGDKYLEDSFTEKRLNYLLALNGWGVGSESTEFWNRNQYTKIKSDFLNLVHESTKKPCPINADLNYCFQSDSLILLQEKLRVILQYDVHAVRILEHFLLQPVWKEERHLNFELTLFLFVKADPIHKIEANGAYRVYVELMIRAMLPAHIVGNVKWIPFNGPNPSKTIDLFDATLEAAFPPMKVYYLNEKISNDQRKAMEWLMKGWLQF